ncbi:hypothetical protein ACFQET_09070 [Levilactobacillus tangyuanensis]|uniref:DUF1189 domain-containing protein n=1 Tax=Levilactobacillus tangyuanensis TaxID=2486021 RepID=A0ABW1TRG9_9LACO
METQSRMARYHSDEDEEPSQQPAPTTEYQRRPGLDRWLALLFAILTITLGLRFTVFNASYTAGVVSRSSVGEKVINRLNDDLEELGVTGSPVSASIAEPFLAQGIERLYGQSVTTVDTTDLTTAIKTQAAQTGVTASESFTKRISQDAQKLTKATLNSATMTAAMARVQLIRRLNLWLMIASALLAVVTLIYAVGVHHFLGSLGPGLSVGGLLTGLVSTGAFFLAPFAIVSTSTLATHLMTPVARSGLSVLIFVGVAEIVLGLLVMLGHRTFRRE